MLLSDLLLQPNLEYEISDLCNDSRAIKHGDLFLAYPGAASDGRLYIQQAIQAGAVAVLYDPVDNFVVVDCAVPCIAYNDLANNLSNLACRFYNNPSEKLLVIGVTGTNGKTTIAYQLAQAYTLLGLDAAYIGTLGVGQIATLTKSNNTTPDALLIQRLCNEQLQQGIKCICMEVSSHALVQNRVDNVSFNQAIYTNLSHEHLDYHHSMDEYAAAKARLFAFDSLELSIINQDDAYHTVMQNNTKTNVLNYGLNHDCDIRAVNINLSMYGSKFEVITPWGQREVSVRVIGEFNIYNSLAVIASLLGAGFALDDVIVAMSKLKPSPGRMEIVTMSPCVIVDYAHTPDALQNVLTSLQELKPDNAKLWLVFGCGGDRDKSKRPLMGQVAKEYADNIIITNDNPRSENPEQIVHDIVRGVSNADNVVMILDREQAIKYAIENALPEDLIVIAGKGHESYQLIGNQVLDFSDKEVAVRYNQSMEHGRL